MSNLLSCIIYNIYTKYFDDDDNDDDDDDDDDDDTWLTIEFDSDIRFKHTVVQD